MPQDRENRWLHEQLEAWRAEGIVDAATAERIAARHPAGRPGIPLMLFLGAALVGVGVIWLVAANLDYESIGPLQRVLGVAVLWLVLVVAAEALAEREGWEPVAGPVRLLATLAYGGTVFQAAQSLQVPAYAPHLVLAWALGALAYAYAVRARGPLVVGVAALAGWYVWVLSESGGEGPALIVGLGLGTLLAAAVAALHRDDLGDPWAFAAAAFALLALGTASIAEAAGEELPSVTRIVAGLVLAGAVAVAAAARAPERRPELAGAAAVAVAAVLLVAVAPEEAASYGSDGEVSGGQTAYTLLACALFLGAAIGIALAGLTNLAYAALLIFLAVQSFGLLATLISGAVLVLSVGAILLVGGILLDRGRRRLLEEATG